ncbi:uncharacterized protein LOC129594030 [Paramacrobiotus metropolitanus]|uniref:uncharacterized protein LOC129594030 n=1 Tax=Paramacrobiotus metropolitanus TaxID=2943436 RepID=UPI0024460260|nr:uncharacterized protein LOC129594030 [Paramacrobiotus metropolitanus]
MDDTDRGGYVLLSHCRRRRKEETPAPSTMSASRTDRRWQGPCDSGQFAAGRRRGVIMFLPAPLRCLGEPMQWNRRSRRVLSLPCHPCSVLATTWNVPMDIYIPIDKYDGPWLVEIGSTDFVIDRLNADNCLRTLEEAVRWRADAVVEKCWAMVDAQADAVLRSAQWTAISLDTLKKILQRSTLGVGELDVYKAADR